MQKMYKFIKVDDKIPIYKLTVPDMIRSIFLKVNETDKHTLKNESAVTAYQQTLRSNLVSFFRIATEPIRKGKNKDVIVRVSSIFDPVFKSVIEDPIFERFYNFRVARPSVTFPGVKFKYKVYITLKEVNS